MMSRETGQLLQDEIASIQQSVSDILSTPLNLRIMRRNYGSRLADLIDQPVNDALIVQLYSAIYTPILRWENRISIEKIAVSEISSGGLVVDLDAVHLLSGQTLNLNIPLKMGAKI